MVYNVPSFTVNREQKNRRIILTLRFSIPDMLRTLGMSGGTGCERNPIIQSTNCRRSCTCASSNRLDWCILCVRHETGMSTCDSKIIVIQISWQVQWVINLLWHEFTSFLGPVFENHLKSTSGLRNMDGTRKWNREGTNLDKAGREES